ncbi:MAG TPA: cupin domain-containing protein [Thermoleophilaceae bacterium]|jgi:mannose-6-phosphate isomerase-like protein (cupin superfamily)
MSYTIKNLREVEDKAPSFGIGEVQSARFAHYDLGAERTGLALMGVKPGCRQAFAHRHDEAEEIYVVLSGTGRLKLDDEVVEVKPLDAIRVAPSVARQFEADDEGLELLALGPRHEGDGDVIKEGIFD